MNYQRAFSMVPSMFPLKEEQLFFILSFQKLVVKSEFKRVEPVF